MRRQRAVSWNAIDLHGEPEKIVVDKRACARFLVAGIETMRMIRKGQREEQLEDVR